LPAEKVPRGPQVAVVGGVQGAKSFLQTPGCRDATGASGARQSCSAGGQVLQGPVLQSLSFLQVEALKLEAEDPSSSPHAAPVAIAQQTTEAPNKHIPTSRSFIADASFRLPR
jgi:hypothetical protein